MVVAQALNAADGTPVSVVGVIQGEINDQFGLKLADNMGAQTFLIALLADLVGINRTLLEELKLRETEGGRRKEEGEAPSP